MAGKELTFKLVIDADTKDFVSNVQQSEKTAKALFDAIKIESDKLKTTSEETAKEVGKIVPDDLQKKADQAKGKLSEVSQAASELQGQAIEAAGKIDGLGNELQNTASKANRAGFEIGSAIPSDAVQLAEMLGNKFFSAAKEIESLGDKSTISAGELRAMSSAGEQGLNELNLALKAAQAELVRLQSTDGTLQDIEIAKQRVLSIQDAINEASSAFNYYQGVAINAMKGVDGATQSAINQVQRFSAVDLTGVVGEAQTATRAIESMGDGASLSTKEIERIGSIGTNSINALERELLTARNAFSALEQSSEAVTLNEIKAAGDKVKGLEQAVDLTKSAFSEFNIKATTAMQGVSTSTDKASGSAKQAGHAIYEALGIKPPSVINDAIADLTRKLENFKANSKLPAEEVARVTQATEQEIARLKNELHGIEPAAQKANSGVSTFSKGMDGAKFAVTALVGAMATIGIGLGIRELAEAADSYTNLSARINIATSDGGNFQQAMAGVHQVALATNSSLDATAGLFTKVNDVGKQMGMTQQQSLDLVKTINMAIQTGGGDAAASEAAIVQLTQALQSGVLRGDEFNSIMEQAPGISKALAQSLGVTTGELRAMAGEGQLSAEKVIKALQDQSAAIEADYTKFPTTIGNALQRIQTQWQILIGTMDQANGASATVAQWLVTLADNMDVVNILLKDVGEGFIWVGDQLKKIDPAIFESLKNALSSAYDAIKSIIATLADLGKTIIDILGTALTSALSMLSSLSGEATKAGEQVSFLERVLQGLSIAFGFIADGATAIKISINLLAGAMFDLASAANSVLAAVTWGDVSKQFAANADVMKDKAKQYYAEADKDAQAFQSKGVARLEEAAQTEDQKNAAQIANNQKTLEQLNAQEDEHLATHKANIEQRLILDKKLAEARKSNNVEVINAVLKEISAMDEAEEKAVQDRIQRDKEKLDSAKALAEASIKSNDGVLSNLVKEDLLRLGIIAKINEQGQLEVAHHENSSQLNAERLAKLKALSEQEGKLNQDRIVGSQEVGKSVVHDEEYIASERIRLNDAANKAKQSGDFEAYSQAKLAIDNLKNAHAQADQERTNQHQESSSAIQQIDSSTFALQKNYSEEQIRLSKVAAQAKKDGDFEVYSQAMLQIDSLSASEVQASQKVSQSDLETLKKKEDITRQKIALAQQIIESTSGIITEEQKLQFEAQGLTVEYDEMGKAVVRQKASLSSAAKALGIDLSQSLNLVSTEFTETGKNFDAFAAGLKGLGVEGKQAGELTYEAWLKWAEQAKSPAEIDLAKAKLLEFEKQGVFSAKQVQMGMEHLDQVNGKLPQNISEVEKAYKLLGITSRKEAGEAADAQMRAFNVLKQSGTASVEELRQALINMADKVYASGDAVKIAAYEAKLAYHGLSKEVSETGQVSVKANNAVEESLHRVRNATSNAGDGFDDLGRRGVRAGNDTTEAWEEARKATEAAMASQGKMKASKTGTTAKHGLSVEEIEQRLKDIGYEGDAKQKAKQLFQDAEPVAGGYYKSASNEWVKKKYGTTAYDNQKALGNAMYVMEQIEKLEQYVGKSGRSAGLNDYAPSIPSVSSNAATQSIKESVNYNIQFGGQTLSLTGDASQKDVMTNLVNQLKGIAKST